MIFGNKVEDYLKSIGEQLSEILNRNNNIHGCSIDFHYELELDLPDNKKHEELTLIVDGIFPAYGEEVISLYFDIDKTTLNAVEKLGEFLITFLTTDIKAFYNEYHKENPNENVIIEEVLFEKLYKHYHKTFHLEYLR
jgi:hypothetical protein